MITNYYVYFGSPERAAITLSDFVYHSEMLFNDSIRGPISFAGTAECVLPDLHVSKINPACSIANWLFAEAEAIENE